MVSIWNEKKIFPKNSSYINYTWKSNPSPQKIKWSVPNVQYKRLYYLLYNCDIVWLTEIWLLDTKSESETFESKTVNITWKKTILKLKVDAKVKKVNIVLKEQLNNNQMSADIIQSTEIRLVWNSRKYNRIYSIQIFIVKTVDLFLSSLHQYRYTTKTL